VVQMKREEAETMVTAVSELSKSYADLVQAVKGTAREAKAAKQLWRSGKNSILIKIGLALIAFPDPTITDVIGSFLVAAGTIQTGIRRHSLYVDDIFKTFQNMLREIRDIEKNV